MPELPEVETVIRTLKPRMQDRRIDDIRIFHAGVVHHPPDPAQFSTRLQGRVVTGLSRRGKYIRLALDDGQLLACHLRMTGRLLVAGPEDEAKPHTHVVFTLDNGQQLRYSDVRRFGGFWLLAPGEEDRVSGMSKLGVEPFDPDFCAEYLQQRLSRRSASVKNGILDQSVLAGLGNIYADETLFAARIRPDRLCSSLSPTEWQAVAAVIPPILQAAIDHNGTTFSDFLDGEGREGENVAFLQAYGRYGQTCKVCGGIMERARIGGRGTCFCPCCQK